MIRNRHSMDQHAFRLTAFTAFLIALLSTGCESAKKSYDKSYDESFRNSFRDSFISSCSRGPKMTPEICRCGAEKMLERYSPEELKKSEPPLVAEMKGTIMPACVSALAKQ